MFLKWPSRSPPPSPWSVVFHREQSVSWAELRQASVKSPAEGELSSAYTVTNADNVTNLWQAKYTIREDTTASVIFTYGWQHWARIFHTMILWVTPARSTTFCREIWGKKEENPTDSGRFLFQAVTVWLEITKLGITQLFVHNTLLGLRTPPASLPADVTSHYGNSLVRTSQTFLSITHY